MRKIKSVSFRNATIDVENMKITEYTKDDQYEFSLLEILSEWDKLDGITLTIRKENEQTD